MYQGSLPQVSNRETWRLQIAITDEESEAAIDLSSATFVFEVRDPIGGSVVLSTTTAEGGISVVDDGVIEVVFSSALMNALLPQAYQVGCTMTLNGDTRQIIVGEVPVFDGIVTR